MKKAKKIWRKIFFQGTDKEKIKFIKKYIPNFNKLFKEEAKRLEEEIKAEIKNKFK